jgi:hypothetical protein
MSNRINSNPSDFQPGTQTFIGGPGLVSGVQAAKPPVFVLNAKALQLLKTIAVAMNRPADDILNEIVIDRLGPKP